jgi:DNA-binding transcriptional LysR family regulator
VIGHKYCSFYSAEAARPVQFRRVSGRSRLGNSIAGLDCFVKCIIIALLMLSMNQLLARPPFDLYELTLFRLVAETGSFTRAAERAGLTQSAMTRQIHGMEERLGVALFERTTRHVALTRAGRLLREKSAAILEVTNDLFNELQQTFNRIPPTLRVGVARSIGLAYLPGYFFAFHRQHPEVQLLVVQQASGEIITRLESGDLDAGLVCPPSHLPRSLQVTHRFADEFVAIVPPQLSLPADVNTVTMKELKKHLAAQRWLMIERESFTGRRLNQWLKEQGWQIEPVMELDSFDIIVNLVSLGLGVSLVPHRVLPLYEQRRAIRRLGIQPRFQRDLAVVIRRNRRPPEPLRAFVANVLF